MTLIIAAQDKENVYIAYDTKSMSDEFYFYNAEKVIKINNFYVGHSGAHRVTQLIKHSKKRFKDIMSEDDLFVFIQEFKKILIEDGHKKESADGKELEHDEAYLLLATKIGIYVVWSNYSYDKFDRFAIGSGFLYGLGYFDAWCRDKEHVDYSITETIKATSKFDPNVGGPITILKLNKI